MTSDQVIAVLLVVWTHSELWTIVLLMGLHTES